MKAIYDKSTIFDKITINQINNAISDIDGVIDTFTAPPLSEKKATSVVTIDISSNRCSLVQNNSFMVSTVVWLQVAITYTGPDTTSVTVLGTLGVLPHTEVFVNMVSTTSPRYNVAASIGTDGRVHVAKGLTAGTYVLVGEYLTEGH